ncbi:MAG TPA: sulfotransferase [Blastocatellia bacterium]|nr:sulfotransferase [Blastocatellia bacterium]
MYQKATVSGEMERMLVEMWQQVLNLDDIGPEEDFFELGGDSIAAVRFTNMLQERLGQVVQVTVLYEMSTIARLAAYVAESYEGALATLGEHSRGLSSQASRAPLTERDVDFVREKYAALYRFPADAQPGRKPVVQRRKNSRAVFLLCTPRSGSTLLRVMLAGHHQLFAPPELLLLPFYSLKQRKEKYFGDRGVWSEGIIRAIMEIKRCDGGEAKELLEHCQERDLTIQEFYALIQKWLGDRMLVDKSPSYSQSREVLQHAEDYFENPLYIHLVRHPGAMIRSYEEQRLDQLSLSVKLGYSSRQLGELLWILGHQNILGFLGTVPRARQCRVVFEDLVREPRRVMEQVCEFLKLEFDEEVLTPHQNKAQKMTDGPHALSRMLGDAKFHTFKSIDPTVADRWKYADQPLVVSDMAWRLAEELGYERA